MRTKTKANRIIDITLSEEKAYFPGETISGTILVHPKSQIKVKPITVKFIGEINLSFQEKETIQLFQKQKVIQINEGKSKTLEAKLYSYPFKFTVPDKLPSTLELQKKSIRVQFKLSAVLDRPMMPETLCPKVEYPLTILELIDVTEPPYSNPQEALKDGVTYTHGTCSIKLSTPRKGYTRGETIHTNIVVNTPKSFIKENALQVDLVRKIKINTPRNTSETEEILKSNKFDLNIIGPYNFAQAITSQFLLRATPPTAHYKSLDVCYMIKARLLADKKTAICSVQLPITVGTWPRADIPIDDDEDEDIINQMGEVMISDSEEEVDNRSIYNTSRLNRDSIKPTMNNATNNNNNYTNNNNNKNNFTTNNTAIINNNSNNNTATTIINVERANSIESHNSSRSRNSTHSWRSSVSTDIHYDQHRNTLPVNPYPNGGYLNRSTSTPDLQATHMSPLPPPPSSNHHLQNRSASYYPQQQSYYSPPLQHQQQQQQQQSYYSPPLQQQQQQQQQPYYSPQQSYLGHRHSNSIQSMSGYPSEQPPYAHRRMGSYDFRYSTNNQITNMPTPPLDPAVPNHTLTFQQQSAGLNTPPVDTVNTFKGIIYASEEDDDSDDDDDLLAIIERKKKKEARELKKKQALYSVVE